VDRGAGGEQAVDAVGPGTIGRGEEQLAVDLGLEVFGLDPAGGSAASTLSGAAAVVSVVVSAVSVSTFAAGFTRSCAFSDLPISSLLSPL